MKKKLLLSLSFSIYLSFCFSQVNLNAGLVAYYPFDGNANDASGNGNNPIFNNATLTNDRFGNPNGAYYFNGVNNYIEIPNSASLNPTQISLVAIVKPEGFYYGPCHGNAILNKGDDNNIQSSYLLRFDDNFYTNGQNCAIANVDSLHQNFYGDYGANAVSIPPYMPYVVKDTWYCVAYTYDGTTVKFYVDGILVTSFASNVVYTPNTDDLFFGKLNLALFPYWFNGVIDEIRIYNRALNVQEVNTLCPLCTVQGSFAGDTICSGNTASLTFTASSGTAPFSIEYSDGVNTYTQNNVQSGVPFALSITPTITSKYYLLSALDAGGCSSTGNFTNDTATVIITNCSLCTGSLGDPIVNITFGSGNNPGPPLSTIAPGATTTLTYVSVTGNPATPTPVDGQYTITNNIPSNPSWFSGATDHTSGNGTGYMAFYNASEQPGEFYKQTINNLCGSTTYEFAAWIANALNPAITVGVNPNITFTIQQTDGTILASYNTGNVPQPATFTWSQYGFYFTTPSTVSTVVLRMINNSPGGDANIGNDFAIDDITFRACGPVTNASFNQTLPVDTLKICADTSITIYGTVSTGYNSPNYLWQASTDSGKTWTDIPNSNALQILVNPSAIIQKNYIYRMMTAEGSNISSPDCRVASNIILLIINPLPQGKLSGENICIGDNAVLSFSSTGSQPFNIIYNIGTNNYTQSNLNNNSSFPIPYQLTDTTTFNLFSITDANGCVDTINATTAINVNPIPQGGITGSTVCAGDSASIIFTASSGTAPFEVLLSDGTNTNTYYGITSGTAFKILPTFSTGVINLVSITDQNGNGCTRANGFTSSSATINIIPSPQVQFDSLPQVCIDQPSFIINEAKEITGAGGQGIFTGTGVDASGNFSPSVSGVGNHKITYTFTSANGCADSASRDAVVNPLPNVNTGPDIITCIGFPVKLNVTGASSYLWSPSFGLDDATKQNPVATLDTTTTFIVKGTDSSGCFSYDTITVNVSTKGIVSFQVPNAFTPNGDGRNDCFGIRNWGGDITVQEFKIYNRWGQLIFSTTNSSDCWDGTFKGAKQDPGGYPYIIKATSPCGNITRTGIVLLIR